MACQWTVLLIAVIGSTYGLEENFHLTKKYTLRFPMVLPVGGRINPMGDICTESLDLLLNKVNTQKIILKDYNVVVDVLDDECYSYKALERVVAMLEKWKAVLPEGYNTHAYVASLPLRPVFETDSAKTIYTPPIFAGAICSGVCKAIGRLPRHFNVIEIATGCTDSSLDEKQKYPNFYRYFRSSTANSFTRKELTSYLGLTGVAILSDAAQYTYKDVTFFISLLSQGNHSTEIAAVEFFQSDPTEAISRLKEKDIRIIFAMCYFHNCLAIACAAYKMKYFGANMIWIFNSEVDLVSSKINRPAGCYKSMTDAFAEGTLFLGMDWTAQTSKGIPSTIGITETHITDHIRQVSPESLKRGAFPGRLLCFEALNNVINIAHQVELKLQQQGKTLAAVLSNSSGIAELTEEFRFATVNVDFQATWGRAKYRNSYMFNSPPMVISQVQNLRRAIVLLENDGKLKHFGTNEFKWRTLDGQPPNSLPKLSYKKVAIPISGKYISWCLSAITACSLLLSITVSLKAHVYDISIALMGCLFLVIVNVLYPEDVVFNSKCTVMTALLMIGFAMVLTSIARTFIFRNSKIILARGKLIRTLTMSLSVWLILNIALIIVLISVKGMPKVITMEKRGKVEAFADKITIHSWETCSSESFIIGYISISIQSAMALLGVFCGLIAHSEVRSFYCFATAPLTAAVLIIHLGISLNHVVFIALNLFSMGTSISMVVLCFVQISSRHNGPGESGTGVQTNS